ncbi:unnamed protein product [Microthlaspi erraticum]|uniref:Endonuclease/exonuclease/phosphatase domain-containing protein n=1 Tax=Microthlaspi erraticum TaxID=1685480 RepID=A0A6D2HWX9_9BRAS|nr:unnamed protein product [Microthlaspi erraticum]
MEVIGKKKSGNATTPLPNQVGVDGVSPTPVSKAGHEDAADSNPKRKARMNDREHSAKSLKNLKTHGGFRFEVAAIPMSILSWNWGLKKDLGYDECVTVELVGLSGGLSMLWKNSLVVEVLSLDKRIIDMRVEMGPLVFFLSCVYGDPVKAKRREVWDRLTNIGLSRDDPWVLVGDFNELMGNSEKFGGAVRNDSSFWDFRILGL